LVPRALVQQGLLAWDWPVVLGQGWAYGPALAAVATATIAAGRPGLRQLGRGLVRWRVGWRWYLVVGVAPFALSGAGRLLHEQLTGQPARWPVQQPAELLVFPLLILILALTDGLGEEVGWRGYALPHLQRHLGPAVASLVLGLLWAGWHLPLFWTRGAPLEGRPFPLLLLALVPTTVLFTWVFNHTQGSVLLAILLHATHNLAGPDLPRPEEGFFTPFLLVTGLKWMLAVLVLVADPRVGLRGGPVPAGAAAAPV
jgi:membrane protease YdiL (CAAX protease family)